MSENQQEPFAINCSVDLSKIEAYIAENPTAVIQGKNGARYINLDVKLNKNGADQYGKTHSVAISATKEQRANKEFPPFVGGGKAFYPFSGERNATSFPTRPQRGAYPARPAANKVVNRPAPQPDPADDDDADTGIPF